jgi:hypothetical protein
MLTAGVSSAASAAELAALLAAAAGAHEDCPAGQIVKFTGVLEPPPPPPLQTVVHFAGAGDGGLKTVTLTTKLVVPELASNPAGILA